MAWEKKKETNLDDVCPGYKKISRAPRGKGQLEAAASEEEALALERLKLYKALSHSGEVVLIKNPVSWERYEKGGKVYYVRPATKKVSSEEPQHITELKW